MKLKKLLLLGLAVTLLASCQKHFEEEHLKYDATKSKALNIALLTGLTTVEHGPIVDSEPVGHSSNGGQGAAMTAGAFDLLTGGGGLGLTTAFMFKIYQPEWENHVFAWMPQDMAKDEAEAASVMCEIMYKATRNALPNKIEITQEKACVNRGWSDDKVGKIEYKTKTKKVQYLVGAAVPREAPPSFLLKEPSYYWSYMKTSGDTSPQIMNIPLFTGENQLNNLQDRLALQVSTWQKMSVNLPSWVYIYIAPNLKTKEPAYFLNQGKKLYFIKPAS